MQRILFTMKELYKESKIRIGTEEWTVRYYAQVLTPREGKYVKAARIPSKKEIWLSLNDETGNKLPIDDVTLHFKKAILPIVIEEKKKEFGEEAVNAALKELGMDI